MGIKTIFFNKTILYEDHLSHDAKIVDFSGWSMPINYGSQIDEHHQVRNDVGIFDVYNSAMQINNAETQNSQVISQESLDAQMTSQ